MTSSRVPRSFSICSPSFPMGSNLAFSVPVSWKVSIDFFDFSGSLFVHKDFLGALSRFSVSLPAPSLFKVNLAWKITFFFYLLEFKRGLDYLWLQAVPWN